MPREKPNPFALMCVDTERARQNRAMVEAKQHVEWWERMELAVRATPEGELLPKWVVIGQPPSVGKREFCYIEPDGEGLDKTEGEVV